MQGRRRKVGVVLTVQQLGQYDEDDLTEALYSIPSSNPNNCIQLMANVQSYLSGSQMLTKIAQLVQLVNIIWK